MTRLIDADTPIHVQIYDDMKEEWRLKETTVATALDYWADEGCPPTVDAHVWNPVAEKMPKPYEHALVTVKGASHNFVETALYVPDLEKWDKNMYKGEHRSAWIVWDDIINCPYFAGDERCHCRNMEKEPTRRECGQCKLEWLEAEVDE